MRIIAYRQVVTVVASAEEWSAFSNELPSEVQFRILRKVDVHVLLDSPLPSAV